MAYQLVERKIFINKLTKLLVYLEAEWGFDVAQKFQANIDKHLTLIIQQPYIGLPTTRKDVRSILVTKHNRLFYKISGDKIIVLNFYDTRINPKKNPYNRG